MDKEKEELIKSMFFCEKLNARLTKKGCIDNQIKKVNGLHFQKRTTVFNPCENCEEGLKRLPEYKNIKIESKICKAFTLDPKLCRGNKDGTFYRKFNDHDSNWKQKEYCCEQCRAAAYGRKNRKTTNYQKYAFCESVRCCNYHNNKCTTEPKHCVYTAKEFHKWLQKKEYKLIRKIKKGD